MITNIYIYILKHPRTRTDTMRRKVLCSMLFVLTLHAFGQAEFPHDTLDLTDDQQMLFQEKTKQKVNTFTRHLAIIANKAELTLGNRLPYISKAMRLFINEGKKPTECYPPQVVCGPVMMEVSSKQGNEETRKSLPLSQYLENLARSQSYAKVEIGPIKSCTVGHFYPAEIDQNGNQVYYAIATYYQSFCGYDRELKPLYCDITRKQVRVQLSQSLYGEWVILLGDASVEETIEKTVGR